MSGTEVGSSLLVHQPPPVQNTSIRTPSKSAEPGFETFSRGQEGGGRSHLQWHDVPEVGGQSITFAFGFSLQLYIELQFPSATVIIMLQQFKQDIQQDKTIEAVISYKSYNRFHSNPKIIQSFLQVKFALPD